VSVFKQKVSVSYLQYNFHRTFTAIPRQQTNRIQGNTATHLDIRDRAMGMQQAMQNQDPPNIPVKNAQNDQQCLLLRLQANLAQ